MNNWELGCHLLSKSAHLNPIPNLTRDIKIEQSKYFRNHSELFEKLLRQKLPEKRKKACHMQLVSAYNYVLYQ